MADNKNQNIDPVDPLAPAPSINKKEFAEKYQKGQLQSQGYFEAVPEARTTGSAETFSDITAREQYLSLLSSLEKQDQEQQVKDDYDAWYETAGKVTGSLLFNTAAMIGDTLGLITDPADIRLPTIGGTVDAITGLFGYDTDVSKYTDYVDLLAWTNKGLELIDDYTFLGDADKTGNSWTRAAQSLREKSQHFFELNSGSSWLDAAGNTLVPLAGSIIGALRTGQLTAAAGQMAGLSKTANNLLNTFIMTESTGISIAQDVHDNVYAETLHQLSPQLKDLENSAYDEAYTKAIEEGASKKQAEWNAMEAVKKTRTSFAEQNPDLHKTALTNAGRGADVTLKAMAPSFALNLITANLFTRSLYAPRNILSKPTWVSGREILKEGIPEAIEEGLIENVAEKMGVAYGLKGSYDYKDLSEIIWNSEKQSLNWETLTAAGLGFLGGGGMAALGSMPRIGDYNERKEAYDKQQTQIKKENKIGESAGISELLDKSTTLQKSLEEVAMMGKQAAALESQGNKEEANAIKSKMLSIQAYEAFNAGTTKNLIENYEKIANDPKATPEIQQRAIEAVAEIKQMEQVYKNTKGKFINDDQIFGNRINELSLTRAENQLQNEIVQKRIEASKAVQSALEIGDATLKTLSKKEDVLDEQGNVVGQKEVGGKELSYDLTKLDENPYTDTEERTVYDTFRSNVTQNVQAVKELVDLENRYKQIKNFKNENEKAYNKITSKPYQKSLKQEQRLYEVFKAGQTELESKKGTDQYMPLVDAIMEKYKGKIIDSHFNQIRNYYQLGHEEKVAAQEITKQEYIRDKYSDKTKESETMSNEDLVDNEGKSPTSEPVAEQTMLDDVARKLAGGATMKTLSKAEQEFYINNSAQVDKRRAEIEGNAPVQETVETEEVNPELNKTGNQILDLVAESGGVNPNPVKPLSEGKVDKIVGEETKQVTLTPQEQSALNKIKGDQIQKPLFHRQLGTNFQTIVDSLIAKGAIKSEGNNYVKLEPSVTVTITTDNRTEAQIAADNLINSEFTYAGDEYQLIVQQSKDEEKNKKIKDAVDVIKDRIKNNVLSGWRVEEGKVGNKNIYKIFKPVTSGINAQPEEDVNYQPNELNENIPNEKLQELKDLVSDYVEIMEMESGNFPSFE